MWQTSHNSRNQNSSTRTLVPFDATLCFIFATKLKAIISHIMSDGSETSIAFGSRTSSKSEKKYSQIDKEATAIIWGIKNFSSIVTAVK